MGEVASKSKNHKSQEKSSITLPAIVEDDPVPPTARPQCGIWTDPNGRAEIVFRLEGGATKTHILINPSGARPTVQGQGAKSIPLYATVEQAQPELFYLANDADRREPTNE
jgi:hypothetical protein